jgi:hypothetical protein
LFDNEEMKVKEQLTIYVSLVGEGVEVYRPVIAEKIDEKTFKIVSKNKNPEDEKWEFNLGDIVVCYEKELIDGMNKKKELVAISRQPKIDAR